ncbi:MAG: putative DNA-binding domain-containing protein [Halieaceae bacterium]|nr:putative DNA-binding domain-containing protein [Halieaceae bacterium]
MPELAENLKALQQRFTSHIRNPGEIDAPEGIEGRRMKIYNDLIYNNVESFLSGGFPVLRSLYRDEDWHRLVRDFIVSYRCASPYFLEISQEFLNYLMNERQASPVDPPFALELAHYEWVELALDVATETFPEDGVDPEGDPVEGVPVISPLAMNLQYRYPVHEIGPGREPDDPPAQPTFLVVYRNREERVRFLESNAATARLLELVAENTDRSGRELLEQLAGEMNAESVTSVVEFGARMLSEFLEQDILAGCRR